MKKLSVVAACLFVLAGAAGCNSDYSLETRDLTTPPVPASVTGDRMEIPAGIAVGFTAVPRRGGDDIDEDAEVTFASNDPDIAEIAPTTSPRGFVVWGVAEGTTTLVLRVDGADRLNIPVEVRAQ